MRGRLDFGIYPEELDLTELREAVHGIEHELDLDEGVFLRKLTDLVRRRRTFESLRRRYDCRGR